MCTDDRFFLVFSRSTFLEKKQDNKQKKFGNLLNIINYMHINPNESGEKFYIITNAQLLQIMQQLNLLSANPKNGQTHLNNSLVVAEELFERV